MSNDPISPKYLKVPFNFHLSRLHHERGEGTSDEFCAQFEGRLSSSELKFLYLLITCQIGIPNFRILPTDRLTKEFAFSDDLDYILIEPFCDRFKIRIPPQKQFFLEEDNVRGLVSLLNAFKTRSKA